MPVIKPITDESVFIRVRVPRVDYDHLLVLAKRERTDISNLVRRAIVHEYIEGSPARPGVRGQIGNL